MWVALPSQICKSLVTAIVVGRRCSRYTNSTACSRDTSLGSTWVKGGVTHLVPFAVANIGILIGTRANREKPNPMRQKRDRVLSGHLERPAAAREEDSSSQPRMLKTRPFATVSTCQRRSSYAPVSCCGDVTVIVMRILSPLLVQPDRMTTTSPPIAHL